MKTHYDAIIIGAGAAGLMCAAVAGQRGRRILLVDHADAPGKKILISRRWALQLHEPGTVPERFLSANPHYARSALARTTPADFLALVERYGITWHEKTLGQLFCDGSARQIVDMLLAECELGQVQIALGSPISAIDHADGRYRITLANQTVEAPALVIACGGPSIPKLGATGFAYDLARRFGLKVVEPRPALVPLTLGGEDLLFRDLAGVSAEVVVKAGKAAFREAALFTHRGLSGPAILQISSYWRHGDAVTIDFVPDRATGWLLSAKRTSPKSNVQRQLAGDLPDRLAEALRAKLGLGGEPGSLTDGKLIAAEQTLSAWRFHPNGTEGFAKAEVTVGGISTARLSSQTMEARDVSGLYAIGEAVDVTGWLGGYNFQWAWASGRAAGEALAAR